MIDSETIPGKPMVMVYQWLTYWEADGNGYING